MQMHLHMTKKYIRTYIYIAIMREIIIIKQLQLLTEIVTNTSAARWMIVLVIYTLVNFLSDCNSLLHCFHKQFSSSVTLTGLCILMSGLLTLLWSAELFIFSMLCSRTSTSLLKTSTACIYVCMYIYILIMHLCSYITPK